MTLDLIATLKTSIYSPKYTKNTKIHFQANQSSIIYYYFFKNTYFSKNKFKQTRFMPMCMAFFIWQFKPRVGWLPAACVYIKIQKPKITTFTKTPKHELWKLYDN